jgi:HNH endonuclease
MNRLRRINPPNPSGVCQCGCGKPAPVAKGTDTRCGDIKGHSKRFIFGHRAGTTPPNEVEHLLDGSTAIILKRRDGSEHRCYIDTADYEIVRGYRWVAYVSRTSKTTYAATSLYEGETQRSVKIHQLILANPPEGHTVDHRDVDGLNNRRSNLRYATRSQQKANSTKHSHGKSKYKRVSPHGELFYAEIAVNKKRMLLGSFESEEDAARAYDNAARRHFGEFARLNFPSREGRAA